MIADREKMLPAGTFEVGQKVWWAHMKTHRFWVHKECPYCDNTGKIEYKGKIFTCPDCDDRSDLREVNQLVVQPDPEKIMSKVTLENFNEEPREYYTTDENGLGIIIQKGKDNILHYFPTKEEAQRFCDDYNKENFVYQDIERFKKIETKR